MRRPPSFRALIASGRRDTRYAAPSKQSPLRPDYLHHIKWDSLIPGGPELRVRVKARRYRGLNRT